jgi:AraC-like DNA-binding protein
MSQPLSEAGGAFGRVSLVDIDRPVASHAHPQCHALFKLRGVDTVFEDAHRCWRSTSNRRGSSSWIAGSARRHAATSSRPPASMRFSRFRDFPAWARAAANAVSDHRVRKAMHIIADQPGADLDLGQVARSVALSRAHFFELFRHNLGVPPRVYRNVVRMERAYRALLSTDDPVGHIGAALGFAAHPHFTRFFRENHGVSPEAYRRVAWRMDG